MRYGTTHVFPQRVEFDDCDAQGIAHHPKLITFLERARCAAMREEGYSYREMLEDRAAVVIGDLRVKFLRPARHEEKLFVVTRLLGSRAHSLSVHQVICGQRPADPEAFDNISRCPDVRLIAKVRLAIVDERGEPVHPSHPALARFGVPAEGCGEHGLFKL